MHWRAHSDRMQELATYDEPGGVVWAVVSELRERLVAIEDAGIPTDRVVLDPGLGFAKTGRHNWQLLAGLDEVARLGRPLLVGASRKGFLGRLLADSDGTPRPVDQRESAHLAVVTMLAERGVWGVRVHDVRATVDALAAWQAIRDAGAHADGQEDRG
jgi:dihydropteroate synthase